MPSPNESPLAPARPYTFQEQKSLVYALWLANWWHNRNVGADVNTILLVDPKNAEGDK